MGFDMTAVMTTAVVPCAACAALIEAARCVGEARDAIERARGYRARGWGQVTACALNTAAAYRRAARVNRDAATFYLAELGAH
jgi:hypothetical protein